VLPFTLTKVLHLRDLSRCTASPSSARALLQLPDLPLFTSLRNVTCLSIGSRHARERTGRLARTPCEDELWGDDELRVQLPLRFVRHVTLSADELGSTAATAALRSDDIFLAGTFTLFAHSSIGRSFELCELPRETDGVLRMATELEQSLRLQYNQTLCVHWRGEDFHHPEKLKRQRQNVSGTEISARYVAPLAQRVGARSVLLLSNARYEGLRELVHALRSSHLDVLTPRLQAGTVFGCRTSYVYGVYAEMHACSRAQHFLGSPHSTFSMHIAAMRKLTHPRSAANWMPR
jgi:hypothetical protein